MWKNLPSLVVLIELVVFLVSESDVTVAGNFLRESCEDYDDLIAGVGEVVLNSCLRVAPPRVDRSMRRDCVETISCFLSKER